MTMLATPDITASLMNVQAQQKDMQKASLVSETDKTKLKEKSKEFESFFVYQMMELMKSETDTEFDGGHGEEIFRHTLNEHMAKGVVDAGGFGISNVVYDQLLKQQEQRAASMASTAAAYAQ